MDINTFDFPLPERLIAQFPLPKRDASRLMVVRRKTAAVEHRSFRELPQILAGDSFLVVNRSRVFPARLRAQRPGKPGRIEVLLVREEIPGQWAALLRPARRAEPGQSLEIGDLGAKVLRTLPGGSRLIAFDPGSDVWAAIEKFGEPPLPPYIHRKNGANLLEDRSRYQTVYARERGSIAAPTAGLHFSADVLQDLAERGIPVYDILLHVGYGTFQPVRCQRIEEHRMEPEYFAVSGETARAINRHKSEGKRLIAVGTTTTRVLEHLARTRDSATCGGSGFCDLFIYPGFQFRMLDGLLTNFHLPRSTLFMLVCSFAGSDLMHEAYRQAVAGEYRFFSYGDCMLIL